MSQQVLIDQVGAMLFCGAHPPFALRGARPATCRPTLGLANLCGTWVAEAEVAQALLSLDGVVSASLGGASASRGCGWGPVMHVEVVMDDMTARQRIEGFRWQLLDTLGVATRPEQFAVAVRD